MHENTKEPIPAKGPMLNVKCRRHIVVTGATVLYSAAEPREIAEGEKIIDQATEKYTNDLKTWEEIKDAD